MFKLIRELFENIYDQEDDIVELNLMIKDQIEIELNKREKIILKNIRNDLIKRLETYIEDTNLQAEKSEREYYYRKGKGTLTDQYEKIKRDIDYEIEEKKRICTVLISIFREI